MHAHAHTCMHTYTRNKKQIKAFTDSSSNKENKALSYFSFLLCKSVTVRPVCADWHFWPFWGFFFCFFFIRYVYVTHKCLLTNNSPVSSVIPPSNSPVQANVNSPHSALSLSIISLTFWKIALFLKIDSALVPSGSLRGWKVKPFPWIAT